MSQQSSLTDVQQRTFSMLNEMTSEAKDGLAHSADLDDDTLVACFDLVRMGLAIEIVGHDGTVYFRSSAADNELRHARAN